MDNNTSQSPDNKTLNQQPVENPTPAQPETAPPVVQQPQKPRRKLWPVLLLIVLAAVAAAGALLLNKPDESKTTVSSSKDVELIRYGTDYAPLNVFYPETEAISSQTEITNQVFEALVKYEGMTKVVPALATGWSNPDTSTWLFDIKPNVTFHNGKKMTPVDVKASIDYVISNQEATGNETAATIKSVEVVGADQVKITTDGPDPVLLNKLTSLYIIDLDNKPIAHPSNGTGPYTLEAGSTPTAKRLDLVAYDKWHGGKVHTKKIEMTSQPIPDLVKNFKAGKLDMLVNLKPGDTTEIRNYPTFITPVPFVYFFGLNSVKEGSPLQKKEVRQAISLALDRNGLSKDIGGEAINQMIPPSIPGFNPEIGVPKRDVAKAKQLLVDAGYADGVTLELTYNAGREQLVQKMIKQLGEANIKIKTDSQTSDDAYYEKAFGGQADIFFIAYGSDYLDGADVLGSTITMDTNYVNEDISARLEKITNEMDASTRLKALQDISKIAADDVAVVPISSSIETTILRKKYNFVSDSPNTISSINFHKVTQD